MESGTLQSGLQDLGIASCQRGEEVSCTETVSIFYCYQIYLSDILPFPHTWPELSVGRRALQWIIVMETIWVSFARCIWLTDCTYDGAVPIVCIVETQTLICLPWTMQPRQGPPRQAEKPQIWEGRGCLCKIDVSQSLRRLHCCRKFIYERVDRKRWEPVWFAIVFFCQTDTNCSIDFQGQRGSGGFWRSFLAALISHLKSQRSTGLYFCCMQLS